MKLSAAVTALTVAALGCAAPAPAQPLAAAPSLSASSQNAANQNAANQNAANQSAPGQSAPGQSADDPDDTQASHPTRHAATRSPAPEGDAFLAMSIPDIKARVRKADATPMSARDRRCRDLVKSAMPSWWGPSGHTVVCKPGTTKGYDFWFDGVAVLTVNSKLVPEQWVQSVEWATAKVGASERLPLSSAPGLCRTAITQFTALAKKAGNYRVHCVPTITWKVPDTTVKDMSVLGYIQYGKRDIAILETRDVASMAYVTAHELGHAVSYLPRATALRAEVTKLAGRKTFTAGPYVGMPAEVWAESFARYWTKQHKTPSIQKNRLSVSKVDALLKQHGLPRR
ncbi:hypothetical protein [Mobilicoccus caccae]|uniref:hypothetical protein n=1 Tax=Mobilicoccus caccae TaxID=1859295 RepID=UPI0024E0BC8B|nr:hypothetical protein [Mobilicoccus caccae]